MLSSSELIYVGAVVPLLVALAVVAIVWHSAVAHRTSRLLLEGLASEDPGARRHVLEGLDDRALASNASILHDHLALETDPGVLDALAAAVARSRWEPSDDGDLVDLRRWVAGRHAGGAEEPAPHGSGLGAAPASYEEARRQPAPLDRGHASADARPSAAIEDVASSFDRAPGVAATATTVLEVADAPTLSELVPRVRALLGDQLERMEFVSIDGQVVARWSSTDPGEGSDAEPGPSAN